MNRAERRRQARGNPARFDLGGGGHGVIGLPQAQGDCRDGHRDQVLAFLTDAVAPTKCPRCGHIPDFRAHAPGIVIERSYEAWHQHILDPQDEELRAKSSEMLFAAMKAED